VHRSICLGDTSSIPTPEKAEEAAEKWRKEMRIGDPSLWYRGKRKADHKAMCSDERYAELVVSQAGRCAICNCIPKRLCLDHDHDTGYVRALLCSKCNAGLGMFGDDPRLMVAAIEYLNKHTKAQKKSNILNTTHAHDFNVEVSNQLKNQPLTI
jgi:hypothetical protein